MHSACLPTLQHPPRQQRSLSTTSGWSRLCPKLQKLVAMPPSSVIKSQLVPQILLLKRNTSSNWKLAAQNLLSQQILTNVSVVMPVQPPMLVAAHHCRLVPPLLRLWSNNVWPMLRRIWKFSKNSWANPASWQTSSVASRKKHLHSAKKSTTTHTSMASMRPKSLACKVVSASCLHINLPKVRLIVPTVLQLPVCLAVNRKSSICTLRTGWPSLRMQARHCQMPMVHTSWLAKVSALSKPASA